MIVLWLQAHFRRLPARYALSVNPDDVPMHMRLLAKNQRNPNGIAVNVQLKKDDDGEYVGLAWCSICGRTSGAVLTVLCLRVQRHEQRV